MPFIFVCITCKSWQNNLAFSARQIILVKIYFFKSQNLLQLEPGCGEGKTCEGKTAVIKAQQQHGLYICENLIHICVHCHEVLQTASLFSACVEAQEPIPTCEEVHLHQRQTPKWRSVPAGANRKELRWLCHLLPIMSVWTPPSVAGFPLCCSWHLSASRGHTLTPSSFPFPVMSLLVIWHSCVFSSIPLWSTDFMPRFLCISVRFLSFAAVQLFLSFWPLLLSTSGFLGGFCFSLWFSTLVKDKGQPVLSQWCSSWARSCLPQMDTIVRQYPLFTESCPGILLGKETLYRWGCAWWQTNGKAEK